MTTELPPDQHIARFCSSRYFDEGEVQASAFHLRMEKGQKEAYLSVNWVEHLGASVDDALPRLHEIYRTKNLLRNRPGEQVAIMNVGRTITHVFNNTPDNRKLAIQGPFAEGGDESHYGVMNMCPNDVAIAEEIKASVLMCIPVAS